MITIYVILIIMGKHYIPRFYLKGFTHLRFTNQIHVYEKNTDKEFRTNIVNVAQEKGFYSDSVEKFLCEQIETPAKPILEKIRIKMKLTAAEKQILAKFMCVLMKRIPRHRERIQDLKPKVIKSVFSNLFDQIDRAIETHPDKAKTYINRRDEARIIQRKWVEDLPQDLEERIGFPGISERVVDALLRMKWIFFDSPDENMLLTNDNPVFFFESIGIGNDNSEVTFPINRNTFLLASWNDILPEGYYEARPKFVKEINRRSAYAATRYVFYHKKAEWVGKLVNKRNLKLYKLSDLN